MIRKAGFQLERYPNYAYQLERNEDYIRRMRIIANNNINVLFDIGANAGQFATQMRQLGYTKKIVSFEPVQKAFERLESVSSTDSNWTINNYALGDQNCTDIINVAGNFQSSSVLKMLPMHVESVPTSKYVGQEEIEIRKLDSVFDLFCNEGDSVMVKVDTQGYEKHVIDGAEKSLKRVKVLQLEMSILPLYENEMLFIDMVDYLERKGFKLFSLENSLWNAKTGQLMQVDGIFCSANCMQ